MAHPIGTVPTGTTLRARAAQICQCCVSDGVPRRSLYVAAIVGTALNLINQGDALVSEEPINWLKVALTFVVPYCVATYGAVSLRLSQASRLMSASRRD